MKKKALVTLSLLAFCLVPSCSESYEKVNLVFGKFYESPASSLDFTPTVKLISASKLTSLVDEKKNFALLVADPQQTCSCFLPFRNVLDRYIKEHNFLFYCVTPTEMDKLSSPYNVQYGSDAGGEAVAIFEDGTLKYQRKRNGEGDSWSDNYTNFSAWMGQRVLYSDMLYVTKSQLDLLYQDSESVNGLDHFVIGYLRSSCPDCSYLENHLLRTFNASAHATSYVIDCDAVGIRYDEAGSTSVNKTLWQTFKDNYFLSNLKDTAFGYGTGYVPTFHFVQNQSVADADVYVNDVLTKKEDGSVTISQSFFDGARSLPYLEGAKDITTTLLNLAIPASDYTITSSGSLSWNYEAAERYHNPLMQRFLDTYLTK